MTEQNNKARAQELIATLKEANEKYQEGTSPLSDEEFDTLQGELYDLSTEESLSELFQPGTPGYMLLENDVSLGAKVAPGAKVLPHLSPMLSLGKAKKREELEQWVKRTKKAGATAYKLQAKLDGFALSATYKNGKMQHLLTRGDGLVGENVSYLLDEPNLTILGLPREVEEKGEFEVRGEVFFTDEQFQAANAARVATGEKPFENPRNSVVGLMKKSKGGLQYPVDFTYCVYSLYQDGELQNLEAEAHPGFITVQQITQLQAPDLTLSGFTTEEALYAAVEKFGELRRDFTIPTDGVVIKPTNEREMNEKMGATSHHPVSQIAYKYPGESKVTKVVAITTTVGKTGKITPRAEIEPVRVDNSTIRFLTCSNYNWLYEKGICVGSTVRVRKANDVIPEIMHVISTPEDAMLPPVPTTCPDCAQVLVAGDSLTPAKTLRCMNDDCPSRALAGIIASCGATYLDIDGLSEGVATSLYESGRVSDIADLFTLTVEELAPMTFGHNKKTGNAIKIGEERAKNIVAHLDTAKELPLHRILASLNIPGFGRSLSKALTKLYPTLEEVQGLTVEKLCEMDGIQETTATKIVEGLAKRKDLLKRMGESGVLFGAVENAEGESGGAGENTSGVDLSGLSFSISGAVPSGFSNRNLLVEYIEGMGGAFHSSPKKDTSYMIGDPTEGSSKVKKASSLGLKFISPEEFMERFTE